MKYLFFASVFLGFSFLLSAQSKPQIGDQLIIKEPTAQNFRYVKFPRLNILSKRGKVANYKSVYNNSVVVDKVITKGDDILYVILKKKDGTKFFGFLSKVKANYYKSLDIGELSKIK